MVVAGFAVVPHVDHFIALGGYFVVGFVQRYYVHQVVRIAWQLIEIVEIDDLAAHFPPSFGKSPPQFVKVVVLAG